jgi:hypothetical protein
MKVNLVEMFQLFILGLIVIAVIYSMSIFTGRILGDMLLDTFGNNSAPLIFTTITLTSAWAVFNTTARTYLIVGLLFSFTFLCFYKYRKSCFHRIKHKKKNVLFFIMSVYTIFFLIHFLKVVDLSNFSLRSIHDDVAYSAGISDFLMKYHKETLVLDPNSKYTWQPYHYFELHFASLLTTITSFTSLKILFMVVYPIFLSFSLLTIKEFLESLGVKANLVLLVVLFTIFGNWGSIINNFLNIKILPEISFLGKGGGTKLAIYPVIVVGTLRMIKAIRDSNHGIINLFISLLFACMLSLMYPTSIPVVVFTIFLALAYNYYGRIFFLKGFGSFTVVFFFILFNKSPGIFDFIFLTNPIQYVISFFPLIIALFIFSLISQNNNKIFNLVQGFEFLMLGSCMILLILRVLGVCNIYNNPDSGQIYSNFFSNSILIIMLITVLKYIENASSPKLTIIVCGILGLGFFSDQQNAFMRFPMSLKAIPLSIKIPTGKIITWKREMLDFDKNTSNWLIYYTIPLSNTRWEHTDYFPILTNLPDKSQAKLNTQKDAYKNVIQKASNYNNNYFNNNNSVMIEDLIKAKTEKN